jgi:UDP-2-acetamido-2-deoxy-ribo-hexuluronate aminotransferase
MDTLQAAILDIKLKHLSEDTEARIKLAMAYTQGLSNRKELILPEHFEKHRDVFHLYVVHLQEAGSPKRISPGKENFYRDSLSRSSPHARSV